MTRSREKKDGSWTELYRVVLFLLLFFFKPNDYFSDVYLSCNMSEAIKLMPDRLTEWGIFFSDNNTWMKKYLT